MCEAYDTAVWLRQIWFELYGISICQNCGGQYRPLKERTYDIANCREMVENRLVCLVKASVPETVVTWVPSRANLSDALTNEADNDLPRFQSSDQMTKPLFDALRFGSKNLRGIRQIRELRRMCQDNEFSLPAPDFSMYDLYHHWSLSVRPLRRRRQSAWPLHGRGSR
jgi:hypothetical protein